MSVRANLIGVLTVMVSGVGLVLFCWRGFQSPILGGALVGGVCCALYITGWFVGQADLRSGDTKGLAK